MIGRNTYPCSLQDQSILLTGLHYKPCSNKSIYNSLMQLIDNCCAPLIQQLSYDKATIIIEERQGTVKHKEMDNIL